MFVEPVVGVTLQKEEAPGLYRVEHAEALRIQDPDALEFFFGLIASYTVHAEFKKQKAAEAAQALKLLDTFHD